MTKFEIRMNVQCPWPDRPMSNVRRQKTLDFGLWTLVIISSFVFGYWSFAQEIPVKVKAEKLKYVEETGMIYASGSVEVELKEIKIFADELVMDSKTNVVTAEGHVKMAGKEYTATSDWITYDSTSEISNFSGFKSKTWSKRMRGLLFLEAEKLTDYKKKMEGRDGKITTCDSDIPHYFMMAERVEYYPEDKVVGWKVTMYVGKLPVLWMPYLIYNLKEKQKRNWRFGHNEVEGDFVKTAWSYPEGLFLLDLMSKKGTGYGIETGYALLGLGTLYLYHIDENDTAASGWVSKIAHSQQINPTTKLNLRHDYLSIYQIPSGRLDQTAWDIGLNHQSQANWNMNLNTFDNRISAYKKLGLGLNQSYQGALTKYSLNYEFLEKTPYWIHNSQILYHQRPLSRNTTLSTTFNYYDNIATAGEVGDQRLDSILELKGSESNFSWSYRDQRYFDLDAERYGGDDSLAYDEKKPEIEIYPSSLDLKLFRLSSTLGYGVYREVRYVQELSGMRDFQASRYKAKLSANQSVPLALGTTLGLGAGLLQYLYEPGDALYAYDESAHLNTNLFSFFRNEASYERGYTDGNTPFFFDKVGLRKHFTKERLTFYYLDKFNWASWTGYNYLTSKYDDLLTELVVKPGKEWRLRLSTGWDIENRVYKDLVTALNFSPYSFFSMQLSLTSDMNQGELKAGNALFNFFILEGTPNQWHVTTSYIYDQPSREFKMHDIMIIKDLHCWEMKYTYSDYLKQFSLVISLKALPDEPVGVSTSRGFYFEGFEKSLKEIEGMKETEVRRY